MKRADQVVLVTGSRGGIGDAVVDAFTAERALVVGADRGPKEGQELAGFLSSKSGLSTATNSAPGQMFE
jgi:NAD(P)-dependent dehydrogenase (short-subunit alcohol dehydrogenase family)